MKYKLLAVSKFPNISGSEYRGLCASIGFFAIPPSHRWLH